MNLSGPFLSWCASRGITTPLEVRVRSRDGYRYVVWRKEDDNGGGGRGDLPTAHDKDGKVNLLRCPLDACLVAPSGEELADRLSEEVRLGKESRWAPYLETLPSLEDLRDMPRFWGGEDAERRFDLIGSGDGGWLHQAFLRDERRLIRASADPWAVAVVDSRSNFLPDMTYSLTPVLDMINHDATVATSARVAFEADGGGDNKSNSDSRRIFELDVSAKSIENNRMEEEEVFISYGELTNVETLLNYGFVAPDNSHNAESFVVRVIGRQPVPATVSGIAYDGAVVDPLSLGTLRRYLATAEELETIGRFDGVDGAGGGPMVPFVSKRNEMETYGLISGFLEEALEDGRRSAERATRSGDVLASNYLLGRVATLERGLDKIRDEFPVLFG